MTPTIHSSTMVGFGIPTRRVNHLCDNLGFEKPGRGRSRIFTRDEAVILLLANHMANTFKMRGIQRMICALKRAKPDFDMAHTLCWELEKNKARCLINEEGNATVLYHINLRRLIPKELLP